jgi:hypothetical protein
LLPRLFNSNLSNKLCILSVGALEQDAWGWTAVSDAISPLDLGGLGEVAAGAGLPA